MKSRIAVCVLSLSIAILSLTLGGCSNDQYASQSSIKPYSENSANESAQMEYSESNPENSSDKSQDNSPNSSAPSAPSGEPTFLIGLDGKPILTSEITRLENTDKTAETLTKDDIGALALCDGFVYLKEPSGTAYNSYTNPELFDIPGFEFLGELPENKNEWKRVYVGDEICGLKLKKASSMFYVNDYESYLFPERFYSPYNPETNENPVCEFEGTITIDGFLYICPNSVQYPESNEFMTFTPAEDKLPVMAGFNADKDVGYKTEFMYCTPFNSFDWACVNENSDIRLGYLKNVTCDMGKLGSGDLAYVRATFGNLVCSANSYNATLENVELLSDVLKHDKDETDIHQPAPVL